jgi:hypothetical protein
MNMLKAVIADCVLCYQLNVHCILRSNMNQVYSIQQALLPLGHPSTQSILLLIYRFTNFFSEKYRNLKVSFLLKWRHSRDIKIYIGKSIFC